jgi:hypothetical protein
VGQHSAQRALSELARSWAFGGSAEAAGPVNQFLFDARQPGACGLLWPELELTAAVVREARRYTPQAYRRHLDPPTDLDFPRLEAELERDAGEARNICGGSTKTLRQRKGIP